MKLELRGREGNVIRAVCSGSMTLLPPGGPGDALKQVLGTDCFRAHVLFDLSRVDYIDSSGVSWLLLAHSQFLEAGGKLIVHSVVPRVRSTFDLLRLDSVLHLTADEASALALAS